MAKRKDESCACKQAKSANDRKTVGKVTVAERDEIRTLYERKNGLTELVRSLGQPMDETLYERIVADMGRASTQFTKWWDENARKYKWENVPGGRWEIDFETCDIYLIQSSRPHGKS